jgi:hypothetical protein
MNGEQNQTSWSRKLRVGVSIYIRKGGQSMWENGIYQSRIFLVMLLLRSPHVEATYLVAGGGGGEPAEAKNFLADSPVPLIDMNEAASSLDLMIEMSAQLAREWVVAFRERGGKIVSMRVSNDYAIDIELMVFDKSHALLITGAPYHEVWTLSEYETTCVPYFGSTFRCPVRVMPHLWSPLLLQREAARLPEGMSFGYPPGRRRWRAGIFDAEHLHGEDGFYSSSRLRGGASRQSRNAGTRLGLQHVPYEGARGFQRFRPQPGYRAAWPDLVRGAVPVLQGRVGRRRRGGQPSLGKCAELCLLRSPVRRLSARPQFASDRFLRVSLSRVRLRGGRQGLANYLRGT